MYTPTGTGISINYVIGATITIRFCTKDINKMISDDSVTSYMFIKIMYNQTKLY